METYGMTVGEDGRYSSQMIGENGTWVFTLDFSLSLPPYIVVQFFPYLYKIQGSNESLVGWSTS